MTWTEIKSLRYSLCPVPVKLCRQYMTTSELEQHSYLLFHLLEEYNGNLTKLFGRNINLNLPTNLLLISK